MVRALSFDRCADRENCHRRALQLSGKLVGVPLLRQTQHRQPEDIECDARPARAVRSIGIWRGERRVYREPIEKCDRDGGEQLRRDTRTKIEDGEEKRDAFGRDVAAQRGGATSSGLHRFATICIELQQYAYLTALELSLDPAPERVHREWVMPARVRGQSLALSRHESSREMIDESRQQCVLVVKVIVHERLAHASIGGDVLDGERCCARRGNSTRRSFQNPPRRNLCLAARAACHVRHSSRATRWRGTGASAV